MAKEKLNEYGLTKEEMAEIKRGEELIEVTLFKDNDKYKEDVYVAVGGKNCVIKRGVPVKIKRKYYLALKQSNAQDDSSAGISVLFQLDAKIIQRIKPDLLADT